MTDKLKPCPFCGGEDIKIKPDPHMDEPPGDHFMYIYCDKCKNIIEGFATEEKAIKYWNKRPRETELYNIAEKMEYFIATAYLRRSESEVAKDILKQFEAIKEE